MLKKKLPKWKAIATAILLTTSINCLSQPTTDADVVVKESVLRKTIKQLEIGKFNAEKAALLQEQILLLKEQIFLKDSIIKTFKAKDTTGIRIVETYKKEVEILKAQKALAENEAAKQNKLMKRQKRKTVFIAIAGPMLTAVSFIYLKK